MDEATALAGFTPLGFAAIGRGSRALVESVSQGNRSSADLSALGSRISPRRQGSTARDGSLDDYPGPDLPLADVEREALDRVLAMTPESEALLAAS